MVGLVLFRTGGSGLLDVELEVGPAGFKGTVVAVSLPWTIISVQGGSLLVVVVDGGQDEAFGL